MIFEENENLPIPYGWYCVGYSDELPVGDVKSLHYFNRDMVMFRGVSGEINLVDAYCPHLGAHLGYGGIVVKDSIKCPFHGWRFDGKGTCVDIPYASKMPPRAKGKCLKTYPVKEVNNIIWAWYHPQEIDPLFDVEVMPEMESGEWTEYQKYQWTINIHVQETGENAADTAHFLYVHQLESLGDSGEIVFDGHKRMTDIKFGFPKMDEDGKVGAPDSVGGTTGDVFEGRIFTACAGPGQTWTRQEGAINLMVIGMPTPITAERLELRFACSMPKSQTGEVRELAQAIFGGFVDQVQQDIPIWENKVYRADPMLCDGDGPIAKYRKWFNQFYAA